MGISLVILAAGQGSRMDSDLPKVLHSLAACPLVVHAMRAGRALDPARVVVVVGHGGEQVARVVTDEDPEAVIVTQTEQLGTAHAVGQARAALEDQPGDVVVLYGDTPFIRRKRWMRCKPRARRMTWSCWAFMPLIRGATGGWWPMATGWSGSSIQRRDRG